MTDNILKKHVERTAKELVAEVYPADKTYRDLADKKDVKRGKKYYEAAEHVLNALVAGSTTLVSDMSLSLAENASAEEMKNAQEQVSGWLQRYDFETGLNDYLMEKAKPLVGKTTVLALDFSEISKPFGGEGMEGMAKGWDGSRHCTAYGHDFISVSLVGAAYREAFPVYAKLGMGRHCHADLIYGAIRAVMEGTGGLGWLVFDRGMDDARFLRTMKRDGRKAVVRVKDEGRDVFGDGRTVVKALSDNAADIALRTHSLLAGIRTLASKARIRFISGRPRTRGRLLPGQLTLDLRTADGSVYRL